MSPQLAYGRSFLGKVDSGFKHQQSIISCGSSSKSTSNCSVLTKTNVRFEAMKHLLLTALRLLSVANVLEKYIKVICSDQSSCTLITKKSQHLKKYIVPMISYAANSVAEISKSFAPIPSVNSTAEWKSKGRVTLLMRAATVILVLTCNLSVIMLPMKRGRREVTPTIFLLLQRSSGYCHIMIDAFHQMISCYLCPLMGMSIESQRWQKYYLHTKRVQENVICHEQDDQVEVCAMWYPYTLPPSS